jgi:hypothetical protein
MLALTRQQAAEVAVSTLDGLGGMAADVFAALARSMSPRYQPLWKVPLVFLRSMRGAEGTAAA